MEAEIRGVAGTQQGGELHREKARPGQAVFKGPGRRERDTGRVAWGRGPRTRDRESTVPGRGWVGVVR